MSARGVVENLELTPSSQVRASWSVIPDSKSIFLATEKFLEEDKRKAGKNGEDADDALCRSM
jgi:hypothetical protein